MGSGPALARAERARIGKMVSVEERIPKVIEDGQDVCSGLGIYLISRMGRGY